MTGFRQPKFLGDSHQPKHRIRCPIHGFIRFSESERRVIDHRLFRRLRWIRQLALTELVYPGATHTRFEHSLGVMDVASRVFDSLARSRGDLMEATFGTVAELKEEPLEKARQLVRLAALLHDVGHCCFSHAAETILHRDSDHEQLTIKVLERPDLLGAELNDQFFSGAAELTAKIIGGSKKGLPPQLQVLRDIVSGQVDADRTDYLLRDSHHCGVDYGRFDYRRLVECLSLWEDPAGSGGLEIAIHRDGIHTFEALILARYQMNTQVYYHRLRRIYDLYLLEYFKARGGADFDTAEMILTHTDVTAMAEIIRDADRPDLPQHTWAKRIRDRVHHREVFATDEDVGAVELARLQKTFARLQAEYPDIDFRLDVADVTTHKLLLTADQERANRVEFYVLDKDGRSTLLVAA